MITIEQLLQNKGILEEKTKEKTMVIEVKSFKENPAFEDGEITIKSLSPKRIRELGDRSNDDIFTFQKNVVYEAVISIDLKNKDLHAGFKCKSNPIDIVEHIFLPNEIRSISDKVESLSGLTKESDLIKEIKK